jgi:hypothetical protein
MSRPAPVPAVHPSCMQDVLWHARFWHRRCGADARAHAHEQPDSAAPPHPAAIRSYFDPALWADPPWPLATRTDDCTCFMPAQTSAPAPTVCWSPATIDRSLPHSPDYVRQRARPREPTHNDPRSVPLSTLPSLLCKSCRTHQHHLVNGWSWNTAQGRGGVWARRWFVCQKSSKIMGSIESETMTHFGPGFHKLNSYTVQVTLLGLRGIVFETDHLLLMLKGQKARR